MFHQMPPCPLGHESLFRLFTLYYLVVLTVGIYLGFRTKVIRIGELQFK